MAKWIALILLSGTMGFLNAHLSESPTAWLIFSSAMMGTGSWAVIHLIWLGFGWED